MQNNDLIAEKTRVSALFIYPVKSCRGIALSSAQLTERGIAHDREWLIVDENGRFVTQREVPRLALIVPALSDKMLELRAPRLSVAVRLDHDHAGKRSTVTVWRDTLQAIDQGDDVAAALSAWIGRPVRLVRFGPAGRRLCNPDFAGAGGAHRSFAVGYPVLVISRRSPADF